MDSYEIIKNYSIFSSGDNSIIFKEGCHNDSMTFEVKQVNKAHNQDIKIYLDAYKYILIHKNQGITNLEVSAINYFVKGMKKLFEKGFQDSTPLWEELKLSSILNFFLNQAGIPSDDNLKKYINIIRFLEKISSETYEGKRICLAIGFDASLTTNSNDVEILKIDNTLIKVLTNGINTLFVCDGQTKFINIEYMLHSTPRDPDSFEYPFIFSDIALWTLCNNRFACVLTQQGEILLFQNKQLVCLKRRGDWKILSPKSQLHTIKSQDALSEVRKAVMATCIDVSFSRTGACIGIIADPEDKADFILPKDRLENKPILQKIVSGKKFQRLDRAIRKELAGLDGAIVIDRDGTIRAIGAILKNDECSERDGQGARSIAAQVLAAHGYGFKVSADGEITVWGKSTPTPKKLFRMA